MTATSSRTESSKAMIAGQAAAYGHSGNLGLDAVERAARAAGLARSGGALSVTAAIALTPGRRYRKGATFLIMVPAIFPEQRANTVLEAAMGQGDKKDLRRNADLRLSNVLFLGRSAHGTAVGSRA